MGVKLDKEHTIREMAFVLNNYDLNYENQWIQTIF